MSSKFQRNLAAHTARFKAENSARRTVGTDPSLRVESAVVSTGNGARKGKRPSSDKGQGHWRTVSPGYRDAATHDPAWGLTVSSF